MNRIRHLLALLPLVALVPVTATTQAGCVMCDCLEQNMLVTFEEGLERLPADAVLAEWAGEMVEGQCWPLDWDTAEDGAQLPCETWFFPLDGVVVPASGETVVFTLDLPGKRTADASWVSPGPSNSGCCGRGLWETFQLQVEP